MQTKILNIIRLIHQISGSKTAYLLKADGMVPEVTDYSGDAIVCGFEDFNAEICKAQSLNPDAILMWPSFRELSEKTAIKSAYIKRIENKAFRNTQLFLVLLSNKAGYFKSSRLKNIEILENFLSDYLEVAGFRSIEESLKEASKNIEAILYSTNSRGDRYLFITDAIKKMLGYDPEEIMQGPRKILRMINPQHFRRYKEFARLLQSGNTATAEYLVKDKAGIEHYIRNSGFPVAKDGKIVRIDGVISDITKEKEIQLRLEKSEERFRLLIETANDLIFNLDNYGYFLMVNNYGALALGYKPEEMWGKHFLEFISENSKAEIAIAFQQILKSDQVVSFDAVFVDKFGKDMIFEIQCRPTKNNDVISGMLGIGRDITQRYRDEEKLKDLNSKFIEANRLISIERDRAKQQVSVLEELNKLKSEFISNISHELRTPLASIVGFSETITQDPNMPREMIMEFSNIILSEGKRLAKLINDVLDFAKMESGKLEIFKTEFDVSELLRDISENAREEARQKGIVLNLDMPEAPVLLQADRERITQVYQHLINNAIKFTDKGGRITVIAQNFMKEFEVIVSDTGLGIPSRDLPNIFQKFYKAARPGTQIPGTGIGLGLVKQIVDLHRGLISVQSEINKGTTFIVKLPKSIN